MLPSTEEEGSLQIECDCRGRSCFLDFLTAGNTCVLSIMRPGKRFLLPKLPFIILERGPAANPVLSQVRNQALALTVVHGSSETLGLAIKAD